MNNSDSSFTGSRESKHEPWAADWRKNPALPLLRKPPPAEFPVNALPDLIRNAVSQVYVEVQAPLPLVATSALSVVSIANQSHIDVARDERLCGSVALFFLAIAESGDRKTTADKRFSAPLYEWERQRANDEKPSKDEYEALLESWNVQQSAIKEQIKKATKEKNADELQELNGRLIELGTSRPTEPIQQRMIVQDATVEALRSRFAKFPSLAILSNEAGIIFGGHAMNAESISRNMGSLNVYWDGGPLLDDRMGRDSFRLDVVRLTVSLMVQPKVLQDFQQKTNGIGRSIGWDARFLVCAPDSMMGERWYSEPKLADNSLAQFHARIREIMNCPVSIDTESNTLMLAPLALSADAKALWVAFHDDVELLLGYGGSYHSIRDIAAKIAENAARIAANLQWFVKPRVSTCVEKWAMQAGVEIAMYYLTEHRRLNGDVAVPPAVANAIELEQFVAEQLIHREAKFYNVRQVLLSGPSCVRKKESRDEALEVLSDHNRAHVEKVGNHKLLFLHPDVLNAYR